MLWLKETTVNIGESVGKVKNVVKFSLELGLVWPLRVKKVFSRYQLDFGRNPNYSQNKVPALEGVKRSKIIGINENLNAI